MLTSARRRKLDIRLQDEADTLRAQLREHGPAADKISRLVRSYLGHGELTIHAAAEGYELHRHGKLVKGPPSEGERTAIALCYFLSTLESDERLAQVESHSDSLDDLIGYSSMTVEEARQANEALLHLMKVADERHEKAIRKQCKAA